MLARLALAIERRLAHANELGHGDKDMAAVYWAAIGEPAADR
jgi:hypothetical protein